MSSGSPLVNIIIERYQQLTKFLLSQQQLETLKQQGKKRNTNNNTRADVHKQQNITEFDI